MNATQVSSKSQVAVVIGIDLAKHHCDVVGYGAITKSDLPSVDAHTLNSWKCSQICLRLSS